MYIKEHYCAMPMLLVTHFNGPIDKLPKPPKSHQLPTPQMWSKCPKYSVFLLFQFFQKPEKTWKMAIFDIWLCPKFDLKPLQPVIGHWQGSNYPVPPFVQNHSTITFLEKHQKWHNVLIFTTCPARKSQCKLFFTGNRTKTYKMIQVVQKTSDLAVPWFLHLHI